MKAGANAKNGQEVDHDDSGEYDDEQEPDDAEQDMINENVSNHEDFKNQRGANPMLKKVSGAMLAKAFLPQADDVKQCLVYTELAIKMQMILFDLSSSLWWSSLAEILIWFPFSFFIFCIDAERMGFIWMFIPHLIRAAVGLLIIKKMPTSHEMVNKINIPPSEKIPFSKIGKFVITGAKESVDEFQAKAGKFLLIYALITLIALVFDVIVIFIGVGGLNNDSGAFSTVFVFMLGILYFFIALYFIGWAFSVRMRLPPYASALVMMGLLGFFKKLTSAIDTKYSEVTGKPLPDRNAATAPGPAAGKPPAGAANKPGANPPPRQGAKPR